MKSKGDKNKIKFYLIVGFIMLIIITAWILNLKNSLSQKNKNSSATATGDDIQLEQKWHQISNDLSTIFSKMKKFQQSLKQSATSSGAILQGGPAVSPEKLDQLIQHLKIETSTTTSSTQLIIKNKKSNP